MPGRALPATARSFLADTLALLLFFTAINVVNERFIAGMTWSEVATARLIGAALMLPVARPYSLWRNWIMNFAADSRASRILWDGLALVSFQVPIYAAILAVSGADAGAVLRGSLGFRC